MIVCTYNNSIKMYLLLFVFVLTVITKWSWCSLQRNAFRLLHSIHRYTSWTNIKLIMANFHVTFLLGFGHAPWHWPSLFQETQFSSEFLNVKILCMQGKHKKKINKQIKANTNHPFLKTSLWINNLSLSSKSNFLLKKGSMCKEHISGPILILNNHFFFS